MNEGHGNQKNEQDRATGRNDQVALKSWANAPAGKADRGINPQVMMKMLITRPVSAGGVLDIIKDMISVRNINTPLRRKSPKAARKKDPQKAPVPAEDMRKPRPVSPALKIVLANTGMSGK